jgi:threonyl-tRNA synthetase
LTYDAGTLSLDQIEAPFHPFEVAQNFATQERCSADASLVLAEAQSEMSLIRCSAVCTCRDAAAPITIYHIGQPGEKEHWWDLCAGPHVESTGELLPEAVDIERTAGAYWRGDEKRQMLTRVYGTAWQSELQLEAFRFRQEEALKRDHRKLGQQLSLFSIQVPLLVFPLLVSVQVEISSMA